MSEVAVQHLPKRGPVRFVLGSMFRTHRSRRYRGLFQSFGYWLRTHRPQPIFTILYVAILPLVDQLFPEGAVNVISVFVPILLPVDVAELPFEGVGLGTLGLCVLVTLLNWRTIWQMRDRQLHPDHSVLRRSG